MGKLDGNSNREVSRDKSEDIRYTEENKITPEADLDTLEEKGFKILPRRARGLFKKVDKKKGYIVVQYLTQDYKVEWSLQKIAAGNIVVIRNRVHKLTPKKIWRSGRKTWYILREIDREPVSNEDYDKVKIRRDDTEADEPLIKAVLGAVQKKPAIEAKSAIIVIIIIVAVVIGAFWLFGGGGS